MKENNTHKDEALRIAIGRKIEASGQPGLSDGFADRLMQRIEAEKEAAKRQPTGWWQNAVSIISTIAAVLVIVSFVRLQLPYCSFDPCPRVRPSVRREVDVRPLCGRLRDRGVRAFRDPHEDTRRCQPPLFVRQHRAALLRPATLLDGQVQGREPRLRDDDEAADRADTPRSRGEEGESALGPAWLAAAHRPVLLVSKILTRRICTSAASRASP